MKDTHDEVPNPLSSNSFADAGSQPTADPNPVNRPVLKFPMSVWKPELRNATECDGQANTDHSRSDTIAPLQVILDSK